MRGPDVGRDEQRLGVRRQAQLQQVAAVQAEDRPAIRGDVADPLQARRQPSGRFHVGEQHQVVHLSHRAEPLVDRADLACQHEPHRGLAHRGRQLRAKRALQLRPQTEPARGLVIGDQPLGQLGAPAGMGQVAGPHQGDPLGSGGQEQVLGIAVPAGGDRVAGVEVQVGDQSHSRWSPSVRNLGRPRGRPRPSFRFADCHAELSFRESLGRWVGGPGGGRKIPTNGISALPPEIGIKDNPAPTAVKRIKLFDKARNQTQV